MLRNKTVLVTGSIAGLGYAIAEAFAQQKANIVLHGLEPVEQIQTVVESLQERYGVAVMYSQANLTIVAEIEKMIQDINARFSGVDIVVNNAVIRNFAAIDKLETMKWDESIEVNLSSAFHTARLTIPHMKEKKW